MKKSIIITLFVSLFSLALFAQESAAELVNAGNAAYAKKDYPTALAKWEAYLAHPDAEANNIDSYTYKCASTAKKAKKIEKARKYYNKCIALDYKPDMCTFQLGQTYKNTDEAKYMELMEKCVTDYPNSKYYKKYFLPSVTSYYNKAASEIFNNANSEAQVATGSGDAFVYLEKMESTVLPLFDNAEEAFKKTLEFDPNNADASNAIANINTQRDAFYTYKAQLAENK